MPDEFVNVRYMVDDVGKAVAFRVHLVVDDLAGEVKRLRAAGMTFRNDIVSGPGGQQILLDDPAGNPIELFQPADGAAASQASRR